MVAPAEPRSDQHHPPAPGASSVSRESVGMDDMHADSLQRSRSAEFNDRGAFEGMEDDWDAKYKGGLVF